MMDGTPVNIDSIEESIKKFISIGYEVHVGCDSKKYNDHTRMITAICLRKPQDGALVWWCNEHDRLYPSIYMRLQKEMLTSIEVADNLRNKGFDNITVHLDINPDDRYLSNKFYDEFVGTVTGYDFKCVTKPVAFATAIADMYT